MDENINRDQMLAELMYLLRNIEAPRSGGFSAGGNQHPFFSGSNAGKFVTTGDNAIYIGGAAGGLTGVNTAVTTGDQGVYIGYGAGASAAGVNREVVIGGDYATGKGANTSFLVESSGAYQGNNSASWSTTSDKRLKKNIVDNNIGLEKLNQIQVRNFEYRTESEIDELPINQRIDKEGIQLGVIAQEIQAVLPDCVKEQDTGVLTVNANNITWYLVNAIQELSAKNEALLARIVTLENA